MDLGYVDVDTLGLSPVDCRLFADAMEEHVDKFLWGMISHVDMIERCCALYEAIRNLDMNAERHEIVKGVAQSHRTGKLAAVFDTAFVRRLLVLTSRARPI